MSCQVLSDPCSTKPQAQFPVILVPRVMASLGHANPYLLRDQITYPVQHNKHPAQLNPQGIRDFFVDALYKSTFIYLLTYRSHPPYNTGPAPEPKWGQAERNLCLLN